MSLFLDTGVLVAYVHTDDPLHRPAAAVLRTVLDGGHGQPFTSDYVLAEAFNFLRARVPKKVVAHRLTDVAFGGPSSPPLTPDILKVHGDVFASAHQRYLRHWRSGLSLTDWTTLELVEQRGLDAVATFDRGFDAWVATVR